MSQAPRNQVTSLSTPELSGINENSPSLNDGSFYIDLSVGLPLSIIHQLAVFPSLFLCLDNKSRYYDMQMFVLRSQFPYTSELDVKDKRHADFRDLALPRTTAMVSAFLLERGKAELREANSSEYET